MIVSVLYIFSVASYYLINHHFKWAIGLLVLTSCICILLSGLIFNSPTIGGRIIFMMTSISGILCMIVAVIICLRNYKQKITVNTNKM